MFKYIQKYLRNATLWIWGNKFKSFFLFLFLYISYSAINNYITLPGDIDFDLNREEYQYIGESLVFTYPEIRILSPNRIQFYESDDNGLKLTVCRSLHAPNESYYNNMSICDKKYDGLFKTVSNANIFSVEVYSKTKEVDGKHGVYSLGDVQVGIYTHSIYSGILGTSYTYSKGYFAQSNYSNINKSHYYRYIYKFNDDWAIRQNLD